MIKTLCFYDFDGTLMDTPSPEEGKPIWKKKTGNNYPNIGWWSRPESLDNEIFDIKPFESILNQLKSDAAKNDTYTILLTARIDKLKPQIKKILNDNNIEFDDISLKKKSDGEKDERIKKFLSKFKDVETINIYDDREKEINVFSNLKNDIGDKYQINLYRANNGKFSMVESINAESLLWDILKEELAKQIIIDLKNKK